MDKTPTGVTYTVSEFRGLKHCVECNKTLDKGGFFKCPKCRINDLQNCEICKRLLRSKDYISYSYEPVEVIIETEEGEQSEVSHFEELSFMASPHYFRADDTHCEACVDWRKFMKEVCWNCENDFFNDKFNFIKNGNLCPYCVIALATKTI